ncbi:MAG: hypothetical protein ACXAE3_07925 [Candidatus Kariarchaeaceae archaeon]|jgi:hypothetical protein
MSFHTTLGNLVPILWTVSLFFLAQLALRRVQPTISMSEWEYQTQFGQLTQRGQLVTLQKIHQGLRKSTPKEMAVLIRDELTTNAAVAYDLPHTFFIKHRGNREIMTNYITSTELLDFFDDPKRWAIYNGGIKTSMFGLRQNELEGTSEFYTSIRRILKLFENEMAGIGAKRLQEQW